MKVNGVDVVKAALWIAARFRVRYIPKGRHLSERHRWNPVFRVGTGDILEHLVRSGLFSQLTGADAKVLQVLVTFRTDGVSKISYRGIMQYAGIGSCSAVRDAVRKFEKMHLLTKHARPAQNLRPCNEYRLTPDDPEFLQLANETYQRRRDEIGAQRSLRAQLRKNTTATPAYLGNTLYRECSVGEIDDTAGCSVRKPRRANERQSTNLDRIDNLAYGATKGSDCSFDKGRDCDGCDRKGRRGSDNLLPLAEDGPKVRGRTEPGKARAGRGTTCTTAGLV